VVASYVEPYFKHFRALLAHPKFIDGDWTPTAGRPGQPVQVKQSMELQVYSYRTPPHVQLMAT
jgi:hypothetical protein